MMVAVIPEGYLLDVEGEESSSPEGEVSTSAAVGRDVWYVLHIFFLN